MRYVALLFAALCLLAPSTAAVAAPPSAAGGADHDALAGASGPSPQQVQLSSFGRPTTEFVVSVHDDRSARWSVTTTFPFETDADRAAFEAYADRYEAGEAVGGPSAVVFRNAAAVAENATGREMAIRDVNRSAGLVNETAGVLRLNFTWTGFVGRDDTGQLVLADVFRTAENTTWFRTLQSGQRLVVAPPAGYIPSDVDVPPRYQIDDRRVVITGAAVLDADQLSIRFAPTATTPDPWGLDDQGLLLVALGGGLLAAAVAVLLYRRQRAGDGEGESRTPAAAAGPVSGRPTDGGATSPAGDDAPADPAGGSDADAADTGGTDADGEDETDVELLSDEERVERLLDRNGGRMRQAAIVQETGWSDAKVSQLLSAMADDERVEKLRLGRENLISLPDYDDAADADGADGPGGTDGT
ncbi:helix-turn-helix transcriptional regulator [Candidatus Halobonum tyrrellensis]|nr:hypothetical protein [Candidatus Halobonum tyrrellensis]